MCEAFSISQLLNNPPVEPSQSHLLQLREMFQTPGYKQYLEALRALQAKELRRLLSDTRLAEQVKGSTRVLEMLGHLPEEVEVQLEAAEKENHNERVSSR
jgi:hypothetical protein